MIYKTFFLMIVSSLCFGGEIQLGWNANTDSPDGYYLSLGQASKTYTQKINVGNSTTYNILGLSPGTYYMALSAYKSGYQDSDITPELSATIYNPPIANFTINPEGGVAPLSITFTSTSTGDITDYSWDFGNGLFGTGQTSITNYSTPNTYTAKLTVTGPGGSNTKEKQFVVSSLVIPPPISEFTSDKISGVAPLTVNFTDTSTGNITNWLWDTGAGTFTSQNATATYTTPGKYTVSLTTTGPGGSNSKIKVDYITVTPKPTQKELIAAYGFEERSGSIVLDNSGNNNTGKSTRVTRTSSGKYGRGVSFNGTSSIIKVSNSPSLNPTSELTISAWVYPTITDRLSDPIVIKHNSNGDMSYFLYSTDNNTGPSFGKFNNGSWNEVSSTNLLSTNKWSYVTGVYNGTQYKLYVNGVLVNSINQTSPFLTSDGNLTIGANVGLGDYFKGHIDEVRIYSGALSDTEIVTDMNTPLSVSNPPKTILGSKTIGTKSDIVPINTAKAFSFIATDSISLSSLYLYLSSDNTINSGKIALYSDLNNMPHKKLASLSKSSLLKGNWNEFVISPILLEKDKQYWVAILSSDTNVENMILNINTDMGLSQSTTPSSLFRTTWIPGVIDDVGAVSVYGTGFYK